MPHLHIRDLRIGLPSESCRPERAEAIARLTIELVRRRLCGRRWRAFDAGTLELPPIETSLAAASDEDAARAVAATIATALRRTQEP